MITELQRPLAFAREHHIRSPHNQLYAQYRHNFLFPCKSFRYFSTGFRHAFQISINVLVCYQSYSHIDPSLMYTSVFTHYFESMLLTATRSATQRQKATRLSLSMTVHSITLQIDAKWQPNHTAGIDEACTASLLLGFSMFTRRY